MTKEAGDLYAKVMVDTPGLGLLDYAVPADMLVAVGDRVVVGLRTRNVVGIGASGGRRFRGEQGQADQGRPARLRAHDRGVVGADPLCRGLLHPLMGRGGRADASRLLPPHSRREASEPARKAEEAAGARRRSRAEARARRRTECGGGGRLDGFRLQPLPSVRRDGVGQDRSLSSHHGAGSCP